MIILGSYGFSSPICRAKIAKLLAGETGKMLIIPLASDYGKEEGEKEKYYACQIGFKKEDIMVFDENDPEMYEKIKNVSFGFITVTVGNTFRLLHSVRKYQLDSFIKQQVEKGAHYLGFSAGAYLACKDIAYVRIFDDNNHISDRDLTALGLIDDHLLCHFDSRGNYDLIRCKEQLGSGVPITTIENDEIKVFELSRNDT